MKAPPPFLGLTGPNSSGKGETAAYLATRHGYRLRSLSDVLREEAKRRGLEPVRGVLIPLGNELRHELGAGALAEMILQELKPLALVDSIRNPEEVAVLRRLPGFLLVAVDAPMALRFERSLSRARPGDPATIDEFRAREEQENSTNPAAQQLRATAALADVSLQNAGSLDALHAEVDRMIETLSRA
jgi:dephospho-CoA kinase